MKRYLLIFLSLTLAVSTFAQKPSAESIRKRFSISTTVFNDFWQNVPKDSTDMRLINQGVDVNILYNFPMDRKGHMFFFAGAGLGAHNLYHKALIGQDANGKSYFYNAPAKVGASEITVKKSKLSLTYFDIPFGFQYKSTSKFHGTLGFKVGWTINDHSKYKGTDLGGSGLQVKEKSLGLPNITNLHYGPFATFGYKWFGVTAFYQIPAIFDKDMGPQIFPISVGITLKPF
jgi:hypothetical protein